MVIAPTSMENTGLSERIRSIRLVAFDFDGVFTDNMVYVLQDGSEAVRCYRGDGIGLRKLEQLGIQTIIISTEVNPVVSMRSSKLRVRCIQGCADKLTVLSDLTKRLGISMEQVAFVGNDINDLSCLRTVGLPIVVKDAHPSVLPYALFQTRALGGQGAVREICDMFEQSLSPREE